MNNKNFLLVSIVATWLLVPTFAQAADLKVTCSESTADCEITSDNEPLFNADNLIPGNIVSRQIEIKNKSEDTCNLSLKVQDVRGDSNLAERLVNTVSSSSIQNTTLADLNTTSVELGEISTGETKLYKWDVMFDATAGNDYQNVTTTFDFNLLFSCTTPVVAGSTDDQGPTAGKVLGAMTKKIPSVLNLTSFPVAGLSLHKIVTFVLIGLIALLSVIKYLLPRATKKNLKV